jgi:hypothetical protein
MIRPMNNEYDIHFSPARLLHSLIFFTILFPFIPSIIPSTDTQPTFSLLFLLSILYVTINTDYQRSFYNLTFNKVLVLFLILGLILISIVISRMVYTPQTILWPRIISFLQFTFAIFFIYNTAYFIEIKKLKNTFIIFAVFSVIYFLSQGLVERILIHSRADSFESLAGSGRGAKTLSPEPSFFALHIFNLYIIYHLLSDKVSKARYGFLIFWVACFCLLVSLSGYGIAIFLLIFFLRYTKISLIALITLITSSGLILKYQDSFQSFRGLNLLTTILTNNPLILFQTDRSFVSRFGSFGAYMENIQKNFIFGDGFTLMQGGGFISIVSSLGLLAALFLITILFEIAFLKRAGIKLKFMLFFWFLINLFSGPIGIPTLGIIVGLVLRRNHSQNFKNLQSA